MCSVVSNLFKVMLMDVLSFFGRLEDTVTRTHHSPSLERIVPCLQQHYLQRSLRSW